MSGTVLIRRRILSTAVACDLVSLGAPAVAVGVVGMLFGNDAALAAVPLSWGPDGDCTESRLRRFRTEFVW